MVIKCLAIGVYYTQGFTSFIAANRLPDSTISLKKIAAKYQTIADKLAKHSGKGYPAEILLITGDKVTSRLTLGQAFHTK